MNPKIDRQNAKLAKLCRRYRVKQLRLFGSTITDAFVPATSNLDFIAEVECIAWVISAAKCPAPVKCRALEANRNLN
jgi:predicted nucleotidyltransferase